MVGWHHRLSGHESEQTLGDGEGQGSLTCCSPWSRKELDTTERLHFPLATEQQQAVRGGCWRENSLCSHSSSCRAQSTDLDTVLQKPQE